MIYWRPTHKEIILMWHKTSRNCSTRCHLTPQRHPRLPALPGLYALPLTSLSFYIFTALKLPQALRTLTWKQQRSPTWYSASTPLTLHLLPCPCQPPTPLTIFYGFFASLLPPPWVTIPSTQLHWKVPLILPPVPPGPVQSSAHCRD